MFFCSRPLWLSFATGTSLLDVLKDTASLVSGMSRCLFILVSSSGWSVAAPTAEPGPDGAPAGVGVDLIPVVESSGRFCVVVHANGLAVLDNPDA